MEARAELDILDYLDYRQYIQAFFARRKAKDASFSFRSFAMLCGIPPSSASFICKVIDGRRRLSTALRLKFAKGMSLPAGEARYFHLLVQFNQAKTMEEKNHFFAELSKFRRSNAKIVRKDQYLFYENWLNSVVWAYFGMVQDQKNPATIAKRIFPPVSAKQVEDAIALLLKLKLIKRLANGYAPTHNQISTEKENRDFTAQRQLREMTALALDVLEKVPAQRREYNSLTMYMSDRCFATVRERIDSFREELRVLLENDSQEDRIYTLTMQLFPNSVIDG